MEKGKPLVTVTLYVAPSFAVFVIQIFRSLNNCQYEYNKTDNCVRSGSYQ